MIFLIGILYESQRFRTLFLIIVYFSKVREAGKKFASLSRLRGGGAEPHELAGGYTVFFSRKYTLIKESMKAVCTPKGPILQILL